MVAANNARSLPMNGGARSSSRKDRTIQRCGSMYTTLSKKKKRMKKRKKRFRGQVLFINTCMLAKEHSTPHTERQAAQSASLLRDLDSRWQAPSVKVLLAMATAMKQFRQIVFMLLRAQNNQLESFLYHAHLHQAYKPTSSTIDYW